MIKEKRFLIFTIGLILFESLMYLLAKMTPFEPTLLTSVIDEQLPLVESFVFFYVLWYLYLVLIPYLFYKLDQEKYFKYLAWTLLSIGIAFLIFFFFPTTIVRSEHQVTNNIFGLLLKAIYAIDTPILNCLPSMHCALCFIFMILIVKTKDLKNIYKIILNITLVLIILSTLLIKQHVIWDALAAVILVLLSIFINHLWKLDLKIAKMFNK